MLGSFPIPRRLISLLAGSGLLLGCASPFGEVAARPTTDTLLLEITGEGYFELRDHDQAYLTRLGDFQLDEMGRMVQAGRYYLEPPITFVAGSDVKIENGALYTRFGTNGYVQIGSFLLTKVKDPSKLRDAANGRFRNVGGPQNLVTGLAESPGFGAVRLATYSITTFAAQ